MKTRTTGLFELARQSMLILLDELASYGVYGDDELELCRGEGFLCHYSLKDRCIYLSLPEPEQARGRFELFLLASVINFESHREIIRLLELLTPWLVAHEIGHHLRHKYGLFDSNLWQEEEIANQLAIAFTRGYLTLAQQQEVGDLMARAIAALSHLLTAEGDAVDMSKKRDPIRYVYTQMCCFYHDLIAQESRTIAEFVKTHLKPHEDFYPSMVGPFASPGC